MVMQGRKLSREDLGSIRALLAEHPDWGRTRLSEELCRRWDWRNPRGRFKDMAARTLLRKLERPGHLRLPPRRTDAIRRFHARAVPPVVHATEPIRGAVRDLRPLTVSVVEPGAAALRLFNCLLSRYHYLGHRNTVGDLPAGRQGTSGIWCATGTDGRWAARSSARRRGSARRATPSSAGTAPRGSVTCKG